MSRITVIGAGYVGLVTAACFTKLGHDVSLVEVDPEKVRALRVQKLPILEPGLAQIWQEGVKSGLLHVYSNYRKALRGSSFVFLTVGTPTRPDGRPDLRQILSATRGVARAIDQQTRPVIVVKSTVPVGTSELVSRTVEEHAGGAAVKVVSNPEFLREGSAVLDFQRPDRVVIGADDTDAGDLVAELFRPLRRPMVRCSARTAELIKYASNAFLCTKISFINEIASICEHSGVDVVDVSRALSLDPRMGLGYLDAGLGWGGSCLPKDIQALHWMGQEAGLDIPLIEAAVEVNYRQAQLMVEKLETILHGLEGKTVAVLGLTFKPNCDDVRESPAIRLAQHLLQAGARVRGFDPVAMDAAALELPQVTFCQSALETAKQADATVLATAWPSFNGLDFAALRGEMSGDVFLDARNFLDPDRLIEAGFRYLALGRIDQLSGRKPWFSPFGEVEGKSRKLAVVRSS